MVRNTIRYWSAIWFISLGFAAKLFPQTPANMDQWSLSIPYPAGPPPAPTGPEGFEGATQSGLDLRQTCQSHQQFLEVFKEGNAWSESETEFAHAGPMIWLCYSKKCP